MLAPVAVMVPLAGIAKPVEALANHLICPPGRMVPAGNPLILVVNMIAKFSVGL